MRSSRRSFVAGPLVMSALVMSALNSPVRGAASVSLTYSAGRLTWHGGEARAACGRGGVRADKREGDGASPEGIFPLLHGFYRADRIARPASGLAITALEPDDGCVDDAADPNYSRPVKVPSPA